MSSRDDETLPISGFSGDCSIDATVDEDFIPTSQPQGGLTSTVAKSASSPHSSESLLEVSTQPLSGFEDDTLPPDALIQETQDKSADFIPDTETKKRKIYYSNTIACKKKLPDLPDFETKKLFDSSQENHEGPEHSTLELQLNSSLCDSLVKMDSSSEKVDKGSLVEIVVNDSVETVDLGDTPIRTAKVKDIEKLESCESFSSDRCEETQVFDNSILLLEQLYPSHLSKEQSKNLSLNEVDDGTSQLKSKSNSNSSVSPQKIVESEKLSGNAFLKEEPSLNSTSQDADNDISSVIIRKIDIKLTVSCLLTVNTTTKEVIKKAVLNVNEKPKPKTPFSYNELLTDCTSDKSKRCSTSSSESVYSDKNGLPFPLPKRISALCDHMCASDSSDDLTAKITDEKRNNERAPWSNEHLVALRMDEIIKGMIENQELINWPTTHLRKNTKILLPQNDLTSSELVSQSSSSTQLVRSETDESQLEKVSDAGNIASSSSEVKPQEETVEKNIENDAAVNAERENSQEGQIHNEPEKPPEENLRLCDGLRVFARWTDKQYYSGVLTGQSKNEKWNVMFDDGTLKAVKEDFIMPAAWLKVGALVFVLVDDIYESGQVTDIKTSQNPTYVVQLDDAKSETTVEMSDLRLSDDLASIIRENYRPLSVESPQKIADVTCDNLLNGKRLRECRTPVKAPPTTRFENSGSKKKSTSKTRNLEAIRETPRKRKNVQKVGLKTENGHLVEDDVPSAESPSGNETGETPFRSTAKEARGKAKPRSLIYEPVEKQTKTHNTWLTGDGKPIPGPSGVKFKKKKAGEPAVVKNNFEDSLQPVESSNRRKRRAEESEKRQSSKKSIVETEAKIRRSKNK